ncbi:MAG: ABC transporter permease [Clostridium sp.]
MGILKYEVKKLFLNKVSIAIILAFTIIPAISNYFSEIDYVNNVASMKELYEFEKQYEGKVDENYFVNNQDKLELIKNKAQFQIENKEEQFYFDYYNTINNLETYRGVKEDKRNSIESLKVLLEEIKKQDGEDSYSYKNVEKKYNTMVSLGEPEFYFAKGWSDLFSQMSKTANLFIGLMIILLASTIFSNEYSSGMDSLIFSTKGGRSKSVKTKLLAVIIFGVSVVLFYNLVQFLSVIIPTSIIGWDAPLRSQIDFAFTPYNLTMLQYFGVSIVCQMIGVVTLGCMVTFISSLFKSSIASFFTSFIIYMIPFISMVLGLGRIKLVGEAMKLATINLIGVYDLFREYYCYNILGKPVDYIYVIIIANIIVAITFALLTNKCISKRNAS